MAVTPPLIVSSGLHRSSIGSSSSTQRYPMQLAGATSRGAASAMRGAAFAAGGSFVVAAAGASSRRLRRRLVRDASRQGRRPRRSILRCQPEEDGGLMSELRKRAAEVEAKEQKEVQLIAENWLKGKAQSGAVAAVDDWVRRVTLLGRDLFVGTASTGIRQYRLGNTEPLRSFAVAGDPEIVVQADHPGGVDPETSITSLAWDGWWLAAGTAGGRVHVWNANGDVIVDGEMVGSKGPCYVCLSDSSLIAVSGDKLARWILPATKGRAAVREAVCPELSCRAHSLVAAVDGGFVVGLDDGCLEIRRSDMSLLLRHSTHNSAISALCATEGGFVTGDASGQVARWSLRIGGDMECLWRRQNHDARVVAIDIGGGGLVITGALDGTVRGWLPEDGAAHFAVLGHKVWLGSICILEDKSIMVTDGRDNAVQMYNFAAQSDAD
eukprot:TRINITY_DN25032_c0_g1_i1.p1 TRINITY_DN25032_c0_g1~~TRINITY_DN25032_c0_g1_i1.p1  ORF type:complete len:473 (+),score=73.41 TRINITY_DN25032_c0_g1_i1:107-1420(+)